MQPHAYNHQATVRTYLLVFVGLGILTALTVGVSYLKISHGAGIAAAAVISAMKCALIAAFFMHLKSERPGILYTMLTALFLIAVLLVSLIPDIGIVNQ